MPEDLASATIGDVLDLPPIKEIAADAAKPGTVEYATIQWANAKLKQGQQFVEASIGYDKATAAIDAIFSNERTSGSSYVPTPKPMSRTRANFVSKVAEDLTAQLTDTRIFWKYQTRNQLYEKIAHTANDNAKDWYTNRLIDLRLGDVVRYYTVAGTGIAYLYYSRRLNDQMLESLDPRSVFPVDPISYHTFQDALGVIIRQARTPRWVKSEYNKTVTPDVGGVGIFGWMTQAIKGGSTQKHSGPLSKRSGDDKPIPAVPTVFVNTMFLADPRTNKTGKDIYMGPWDRHKNGQLRMNESGKPQPQSPWSYIVKPDAPLYPFKRMIVWTTECLLYDGPSPYWHGKFPLIKLTLNPWPNSWLGKAPLWDLLPLQESMDALLRVIDDHAAQLAQPGVVADRNVSGAELKKFNSRAAGWNIRTNTASGKGIQVVPPPPLDQSLWQHVNWIREVMQTLSGTVDASMLAGVAQIPSDDTIDTIMKAMTPGNRSRSRILEGFMKELAEMYLYNLAEFDTISKRVAKFGPGAVTDEDFDYEPGSFVPDNIPGGEPGDIANMEDALAADEPMPRYDRAKRLFQSFTYEYQPTSLLNSAAMQDRMEDFMLAKMGYIDWFTFMQNLGKAQLVPANVKIPDDIASRFQLQQQLGIGMIANAQGRKATDSSSPSMGQNSGGPTIQTS